MATKRENRVKPKSEEHGTSELSEFGQDLLKRLGQFPSAPVLFVGAGISRRYKLLPSWSELLNELALKTGTDYAYFRSTADGDLPTTASLMAEPLSDVLWKPASKALMEKHKDQLVKKDSALKVFVADRMLSLTTTTDKDLLGELDLLKRAVIDAVITTNYDTLIEEVFADYEVYVGQDELLFSEPRGVGEIYKIHGSAKSPNTIVITREDYDAYNERNAYLAAKLLTLFAEHPVFFLGYSMGDENVTRILESLVKCIKPEQVSKLQDRLFFVHWNRAGGSPAISNTVVPIQGTNLPVVNIDLPDYVELYTVLGRLKRKFSAHTLRRLKDHIYELILTNDPKGRLHVTNIEDLKDNSSEVVVGIGAIAGLGRSGYRGVSRTDVILDVLHDEAKYDPELIVKETLPTFLPNGNFPLIKYLVEAGFINSSGKVLREKEMDSKLVERYRLGADPVRWTNSTKKIAKRIAKGAGDFGNLIARNDLNHTLLALPALDPSKVTVIELQKYLVEHEAEATKEGKLDTNFTKAVCLLERLKFLDSPW